MGEHFGINFLNVAALAILHPNVKAFCRGAGLFIAFAVELIAEAQLLAGAEGADSFQKNIKNDNWQDRSFKLVKIPDDDFKRHKETMQVLKYTVYRELSYTHSEEMTEKEEGLSL